MRARRVFEASQLHPQIWDHPALRIVCAQRSPLWRFPTILPGHANSFLFKSAHFCWFLIDADEIRDWRQNTIVTNNGAGSGERFLGPQSITYPGKPIINKYIYSECVRSGPSAETVDFQLAGVKSLFPSSGSQFCWQRFAPFLRTYSSLHHRELPARIREPLREGP